jgi:excisionase family DNA binding protein
MIKYMSRKPPPLADLMTSAEVADMFHVSSATVYRWARKGQLRFVRTPGRQRRFFRAEVQDLFYRRLEPGDQSVRQATDSATPGDAGLI